MPGLSEWLTEQEARFSPFFAGCHPGAREHVMGLLILHAATCGENLTKGRQYLAGLLDLYRLHGNSPFGLPVDGWGRIRHAQQFCLADELKIDVCDRRWLPDAMQPIPEEIVIESLKGLLQAAPIIESLLASQAIAEWLGLPVNPDDVGPLEADTVQDLRLVVDAGDQGVSALPAFWRLAKAYEDLSLHRQVLTSASCEAQLSFEDHQEDLAVPVDVPNWILSNNLAVTEYSAEDAYFARVRLYIACLEWYRIKKTNPRPMASVTSAVVCSDSPQYAVGA